MKPKEKKLVCLNIRTNYEDSDKPQEQNSPAFPGRGIVKKNGGSAGIQEWRFLPKRS